MLRPFSSERTSSVYVDSSSLFMIVSFVVCPVCARLLVAVILDAPEPMCLFMMKTPPNADFV
jgi:hypothetical protein